MKTDDLTIHQAGSELLVCGSCGRVNQLTAAEAGQSVVRCSSCAATLRVEAPSRLSVRCPTCRHSLEISSSWLGQSVVCGQCSAEFVVERVNPLRAHEDSHNPLASHIQSIASTSPPQPDLSAVKAAEMSAGNIDVVSDDDIGTLEDLSKPSNAHESRVPRVSGAGFAPDSPEDDEELEEYIHEAAGPDGKPVMKVRRVRRKKRRKKNDRKDIARIVVATALTFALIYGGYYIVKSDATPIPPPVVQAPAPAIPGVDSAQSTEAPTAVKMETEEITRLNDVLSGFLGAQSPEQMLGLARFPSQVGTRIRRYYDSNGFTTKTIVSVKKIAESASQGRLFLRYETTDAEGKVHNVIVERTAPNQFLVDWDSHVRYASTNWDLYVARRTEEPERFQLFVKRDFVGSSDYPIDNFNCYYVFWKDESDGVPLFVPRASAEDHALMSLTEPYHKLPAHEVSPLPGGAMPATMEVFFRKSANREGSPAVLEMKTFFHEGWVNLESGI